MKSARGLSCFLTLLGAFAWGCSGGGGGDGGEDVDPRAVSSLVPGRTAAGTLAGGDWTLPDGTSADLYKITLAKRGTLTVRLESSSFDARLGLFKEEALREQDFSKWPVLELAQNDDVDPLSSSAAISTFLDAGTYAVRASGAHPSSLGPYALSVSFIEGADLDLTGVWAGTWEGVDSIFGKVTGNWELEARKDVPGVAGTMTLSGDVDCADGELWGSLVPGSGFAGHLIRGTCPYNAWYLTALDFPTRRTSGIWTKPATNGTGTFTGTQIAVPGGPRIASVSPPGALPGALVTLAGSGFSTLSEDGLLFESTPAEWFVVRDDQTLTTVVPAGASRGQLTLTTPEGTAFSPIPFNPQVTSPGAFVSDSLNLGGPVQGVAVSPDGRRAYVAVNGAAGAQVAMIDTGTNRVITSTPVSAPSQGSAQGLAVSPDGRRVYAAAGGSGVAVLHGVTNQFLEAIPVNAGGGAQWPNPQSLALSPDGALTYVADNRDGGAVRVVDLGSKQTVATLSNGSGWTPSAVAANPDGVTAYAVFSSPSEPGQVAVFWLPTRTVSGRIAVGSVPRGAAVSPDGTRLYVSNSASRSLSVINTASKSTVATVALGAEPGGVAVSPDGRRVYVACDGGGVAVLDAASGVELQRVGGAGIWNAGIAMAPDGKKAYVTDGVSGVGAVTELGGPARLRIDKGGNGIGEVTSNPPGIACGPTCQSDYDRGTQVQLIATPAPQSTFAGWAGDADCLDGVVSLDASKRCTATFQSASSYNPGQCDSCVPVCFVASVTPRSSADGEASPLFRLAAGGGLALGLGLADRRRRGRPAEGTGLGSDPP